MKINILHILLFLLLTCANLYGQQYGLAMIDTSLAIIDESSILKEVKSQIFVDKSTESGEILLQGNFAKISINNLQIGDLGGNELGIDGDIVPYQSTTFDLGNNVVGEHWDQVVANTFVTYSPPGNIRSSTHKSLDSTLPALLQLTPFKSIEKNKGQSLQFDIKELMTYTPEVVILSDIDHNYSNNKIISKKVNPGINYDAFIPLLIKAMQEQNKQIVTLRDEVEILREKLENN